MMNKTNKIPYIAPNENGVPNLHVDNEPFLIIGGELHNSSASSLTYMEEQIWPYLRDLHLNTVLLPIAWEDLEPEEGIFDDTLLEGLLNQARRENVRLVLLWFGLWKNGESFYVPGWVKKDCERFFRAEYANHSLSNTISLFCEEAVEKDKIAFCHLMTYLKEHDADYTVIMVQVENEIGFLGAERDFSFEGSERFKMEIPDEVAARFEVRGNWQEAFGEDAGESFMAYYYGKAVEKIASAGKEIHPLPLYVNAWLAQHPERPGIYPSGGPVVKMLPMWKLAAPTISLFAPDIYLPEFKDVCERYLIDGNPLFIPETGRNSVSASNVFYFFGQLNGLGFCPFGIEDVLKNQVDAMSIEQLAALNIAEDCFYARETAPYLIKSYKIIHEMKDILIANRGTAQMVGYIKQNSNERGCIMPMDSYDLQLDYIGGSPGKPGSGGIVLKAENGFYIIGCNVRFTVLPKKGSNTYTGISRYEEGEFRNGVWKRGRVLNGDEGYDLTLKDMPECKYVGIYTYPCKNIKKEKIQ